MNRITPWMPIPVLAALWLLPAGPAAGQKNIPAFKVIDNAGIFSSKAEQKADEEIAQIKRRTGKDLLIETFRSAEDAPSALVKKSDLKNKEGRVRFFKEWALERANTSRVNGIYLLICMKPRYVESVVGEQTRKRGAFTPENAATLRKKIQAHMPEDPDEALRAAVSYVASVLPAETKASDSPFTVPTGKVQTTPPPTRRETGPTTNRTGSLSFAPLLSCVCIGLFLLVAAWGVFGLIRAFTRPRTPAGPGYDRPPGQAGPGYGGPGYGGPGYGAPGYGGGGGGFLSSMLGGLFGAGAGMWLYNNIFGGHASQYGGTLPMAPPTAPYSDRQTEAPSDVGGDYTAGGDDFGDNAGGGDFGGGDTGGGDFGGDTGGGDVGGDVGGGDFGGDVGGGDFGGGDFGGGGGDVGGGDW